MNESTSQINARSDIQYNEYFDIPSKLIVLVLIFCFAFLLFEVVFYSNTWDDAYISYRYAKNFVENKGIVYNPGEYVEGYTTFLWVMLVGLIGKLGFNIPIIGKVLSVLFGIGTLIVTYFIGRDLGKKYYTAALLSVLLLTFRIDYGVHFQSGMETSFHGFILSLAFYMYLKRYNGSLIVTGIFAGLLPLIHPEGILFSIGVVINELIDNGSLDLKRKLKNIGLFLLPVVLIILSHLIWRYSYYGELLPNTFYAKSPGSDLIKYVRGAWYLTKFFIFGGGFLYYLPALYFIFFHFKNKRVRILSIVICLYLIFNVYASGDWSPYSRFMMPVLPLVLVSVAYGILKMLSVFKANKIAAIFVVLVFIVTGYQNGIILKIEPTVFIKKHREQHGRWKALCKRFREIKEIYPNLTIASNPIGMIGYYSEARIIDMLGLTNRHIAKEGKQIMGAPGHERWDIEYVINQKPEIIYPGGYIVSPNGELRPSLGDHTSEEVYQRINDEYRMVIIPDIGEYWIRKDLDIASP